MSEQFKEPSKIKLALSRAILLAQKKMASYRKKWEAAEEDARSSDARWNEKFTDYWKGRCDALRDVIKIHNRKQKP